MQNSWRLKFLQKGPFIQNLRLGKYLKKHLQVQSGFKKWYLFQQLREIRQPAVYLYQPHNLGRSWHTCLRTSLEEMGSAEKSFFIFEKENSDILYSFTICWCEFPLKHTPTSLRHVALLLPFFSTRYTTWTNESAKKPKASRATGLSSTEGLY